MLTFFFNHSTVLNDWYLLKIPLYTPYAAQNSGELPRAKQQYYVSYILFLIYFYFYFLFFLILIFIFSWRLITLQYYSGFCHTLKWISHGFTCVPHPDPPSHLPLHPIPLGLPSAPGLSSCLMHPTWAGDLFHPR